MIGFVAGLLALAPTAGVPVVAVDPAPTGVQVSWENPRREQRVRVTWQEVGDLRNRIDVVPADGTPTDRASVIVEAGQPNDHVLAGWTPDRIYRVEVRSIDSQGAVSEPTSSPAFDTDRPVPPVMKPAVPREDGTVEISWTPGTYRDLSPNDPLDLPAADPPQYVPLATVFTFNEFEDVGPATTATKFVVPKRDLPANFSVRTVPNEWGGQIVYPYPWVLGSKISATIPKKATTGKPLKVTGKALRVVRQCDPGPCGQGTYDDSNRLVRLEARTGANSAWESVATIRTAKNGTFTLQVTAPSGTRQYRVVAPVVLAAGEQLAMGFAATPVTTTKAVAAAPAGDTSGSGGGGGLAITGPPVGLIAAAGGVFVAFGLLLTLAGRRRRRA